MKIRVLISSLPTHLLPTLLDAGNQDGLYLIIAPEVLTHLLANGPPAPPYCPGCGQ